MLVRGVFRRTGMLFSLPSYDFVFVHREVTPAGPPVFEWVIAKIFKKKIIYDFDDAIWMTDKVNESYLEKIFRWRSKVNSICKWSYKVSAGNEYLAAHAGKFNANVVVNPTTIDTENLHNKNFYTDQSAKENGIVIGWTGSHSTLKYLEDLTPVLQQMEEQNPNVSFLVIADKSPTIKLKNLIFTPWSKETEIADLAQLDIGIMPLPDDQWAKGKCGFKALQYMALEIPCIASPVGVNTSIIQHGVNGFLCNSPQEWMQCFEQLSNEALRKKLGQEGRKTVESSYSVRSNCSNFLSLFE